MLEMKLIIKGVVQGVGYRYSIVAGVEKLSLPVVGYVKNLADGSVEILAHGDIESLKSLRKVAREGSSRSNVREIIESELTPVEDSEYSDFSIQM